MPSNSENNNIGVQELKKTAKNESISIVKLIKKAIRERSYEHEIRRVNVWII